MDGFLALYIFMLAAITGHVIISRVPVILHTPLMSGSNFVHGIVWSAPWFRWPTPIPRWKSVIGFIAVLLGAGNAAGGYVVTERMLDMFKSSRSRQEGGKLKWTSGHSPFVRQGQLFRRPQCCSSRPQAHGLAGHRARGIRWAGSAWSSLRWPRSCITGQHNIVLIFGRSPSACIPWPGCGASASP
jgi:NAD(P) transhydrogenase subunit alpha